MGLSDSKPGWVSVVIPAYNAAHCIGQTLESVFAQTWPHYEVIVVNDGSPDTGALEEVLAAYMSRIRYMRQENRGPSAARNCAIKEACGQYVAFLDSDDVWFPHHLENQVKALQSGWGMGMAYANPVLTDDGVAVGTAFDLAPQSWPVTLDALLRGDCRIGTSSVVGAREVFLEAGLFDESMRRCEDFDLWLRVAYGGTGITYNSGAQLRVRRANGLSADGPLMKQARIAVYRKTALIDLSGEQRAIVKRRVAEIETDVAMEQARLAMLSGQYKQARAALARAGGGRKDWRLRLAVAGLLVAPGIFKRMYAGYERVLMRRNQARNARRSKRIKLP